MRHFIIDYALLCKMQDSGVRQVCKLFGFILFFGPNTYFIHDAITITDSLYPNEIKGSFYPIGTMGSLESIALSVIALIPYYYICKKCNSPYRIFITIYLYSVLYSFLLSAIIAPIDVFYPNRIFHWMHMAVNQNRINLFLTYGFVIYLIKNAKRVKTI